MPLVAYLDEVGNPTLNTADKDFPVFAVVLWVCDRECYVSQVIPAISRLKIHYLGHEGISLHSRDIRKRQGDFAFLNDDAVRAAFLADLTAIMDSCEYQLFATAIRKDKLADHNRCPRDPYELALMYSLERLLPFVESRGEKRIAIIAEKRGKVEDRKLALAFDRIVHSGTESIAGARFRRIDFSVRFVSKAANTVGTQLADLAAYPIARHVLDSSKPNPAFDVVGPKLFQGPGGVHGLKVLP